MRTTLVLLFGMGLAAPAAAQGGSAGSGSRTVLIVNPNHPGRTIIDTMGTPYEVPQRADSVFTALVAVYQDLKIPAELRNLANFEVGNEWFDRRGDVAGIRMSALVDCGSGPAGDYADFNRVTLSLISFVSPTPGGGATLRSVLLGFATTESARGWNDCRSMGELENRIYKMLAKKLGR